MRHAVVRVGGVQAGHVDQVGNHGRGGRLGTGALAVVQRSAHGVALHQYGVHRAFDVGDQAGGGHQRRMHAQLHAVIAAAGDAEQLDAVAQFLGVLDIGGGQLGNAFHVRAVELHRHAERDRAHQRDLVRGIDALDVKRGIGLGVAQLLRFLQDRVEIQALVAHLRQDEVGGAVDDAGDPLDAEQANFDGVHGQSSELLRMGCGAAREIRPLPCRGVFGTPRESARCG
ncbi:hypothetical protein FQZ97_878770 [compost metagenome]